VLDGDVPDGDSRTEFTEEIIDGVKKRVKPLAKKFSDYLILLLHEGDRKPELMTFTLSGTQLRRATDLNTILKLANMPSFAFVIKGSPKPEKRTKGEFYGWAFEPAGWPSEAVYNLAESFYEELKGKQVHVEAADVEEVVPTDGTEIPF
jgi:hypothetical protein